MVITVLSTKGVLVDANFLYTEAAHLSGVLKEIPYTNIFTEHYVWIYMCTLVQELLIVFMMFLIAGVCKIYEEHLKRQNPNTPSITYDISQLFDFVDQLADLSCLVYVAACFIVYI